jgi:hypothetical protein
MDIQAQAQQALAIIEKQTGIQHQAIMAANAVFKAATRDAQSVLDALEERYDPMAFELACEAGKAPFTPDGQRQQPTSVSTEDEGLLMTWDNSHHYASHLATWVDLQAREQMNSGES